MKKNWRFVVWAAFAALFCVAHTHAAEIQANDSSNGLTLSANVGDVVVCGEAFQENWIEEYYDDYSGGSIGHWETQSAGNATISGAGVVDLGSNRYRVSYSGDYTINGGTWSCVIHVSALVPTADSITAGGSPCDAPSFLVFANNVKNAVRVCFPTWTDSNGQDDIIWYEGYYDAVSNCWKRGVNINQHNNERGNYTIHAYAIDGDGGSHYIGATNVDVTYTGPNVEPMRVTLTPSSTTVGTGGSADFAVSASCGAGSLGEIGFVECDFSGRPLCNLGAVGVLGQNASYSFNWSTPEAPHDFRSPTYHYWSKAPGTRFFRAYAWNSDGSETVVSDIVTINLYWALPFGYEFEGWTLAGVGAENLVGSSTWRAWNPQLESTDTWMPQSLSIGEQVPNLPTEPAPSYGPFDDIDQILAEYAAEENALNQQLYQEYRAAEIDRINDQIKSTLASGKAVKLIDSFGDAVKFILPDGTILLPDNDGVFSNELESGIVSGNTIYLSPIDSSPASSDDVIVFPELQVRSADPATFDWDGYFAWFLQNGFNGTETGASITLHPYNNTLGMDCGPVAFLTVIKTLNPNANLSLDQVRDQVASAQGTPGQDWNTQGTINGTNFETYVATVTKVLSDNGVNAIVKRVNNNTELVANISAAPTIISVVNARGSHTVTIQKHGDTGLYVVNNLIQGGPRYFTQQQILSGTLVVGNTRSNIATLVPMIIGQKK